MACLKLMYSWERMLIYVHRRFLSGLKLDLPLLDGLLNVEAEDSALVGTMVGSIVKLAVFLPFKFFSRRDYIVSR